jgi:hypothetical protein
LCRESSILQQKGGRPDASVLYEMSCQKGDEGSQGHNDEEWEAGYSGDMSHVWDQDVQDREELSKHYNPNIR